ncbi:MAG: hypothetical protein JST16_06590 [Bdellovibrionales bacterium]|nr:hypothetical protein [Bdellovibrionales bacterium]
MNNMKYIYTLFILYLALPFASRADTFHQEWDAIPQSTSYEYEISESPKFEPSRLIRQGTVNQTQIETELRAGIYYFRLRGIEGDGRTGQWTPANKVVIKGGTPALKSPRKDERIEVLGSSTPISFEWNTIEGATDYELRLEPTNGAAKTYITPVPSIAVKDLSNGTWQARITARVNGDTFSKSQPVAFSIVTRALPRPRILEPLENSLLTAWEPSSIRWTRSMKGQRSRVIITRVDVDRTKVMSEEPIHGKSETRTSALPPGRYQITVQDFPEEGEENSSESVTVTVEEDPMGYHAGYLGATLRFPSIEPLFGSSSMTAPALNGEEPVPALGAQDSGPVGFNIEARFSTRIYDRWGAEAMLGGEQRKYTLPTSNNGSNTDLLSFRGRVSGTYRWEPLGPTKPVFLKGGVFGREFKQLSEVGLNANGLPANIARTYAQQYGLSVGAEFRYGGWNPNWDWLSEARMDLPLMLFGSTVSGSGTSFFPPALVLEAFLRTKISTDLRMFLGPTLHYEDTSAGDTSTYLKAWGLKFGFEIDF